MLTLQICLLVIGVIFIVGSLIPLFPEQTWWLRAWTYGRLQQVVILIVIPALYVALYGISHPGEWLFLGGAALAVIVCVRDIWPFMRFAPIRARSNTDAQADRIRILVANVLQDNRDYDALLSVTKTYDPDIVFLVETDKGWEEGVSSLKESYPYTELLPLEDYNGMLFYSRLPIVDSEERRLVQEHIPSLNLDLEMSDGQVVQFYGLHPRPPRPKDDTANLDKELEIIARESAEIDRPIIIGGDLNDVGWSKTTKRFLKISGLKDPRRGRGLFNSYNAKWPWLPFPLDHFFYSDDFALVRMERGPKFGSDHFPMFIELAYSPQK